MAGQNSLADSYRVFIIGLVMIILLSAGSAFGQFIIQPMRFELTAAPGGQILESLQLQNYDPNRSTAAALMVADLSQYEDGSWRTIEPNEPDSNDVDVSKLSSCKDWISLSQQTVEVNPVTIAPVRMVLRVPRGVRGFYSAGIVVRLRPGEVTGHVGLIFEYVIPVLVHIEGRPVQHQVELTDVGLELQPASETTLAETLVSMSIANRGQSYSQLMGLVRIWGFFKEHWRKITERELRVGGILPGSDLKLTDGIGRSLPPGKYKVAGWLLVGGRRVKPIEKEIDFAGDPNVSRLATDAALDLTPSEVIIDSLPGATRTAVLQAFNASDEDVNVRVRLALPPVLKGVVATFRGEDLDCTDWLEITPNEFKLPSYGRQNIRIIAKMPNPEAKHACYYALLGLFATYPDGQNAGLTTTHICLVNQTVQGKPQPRPAGPVSLALQSGSKYIVTSTFTNYGDVHLTPRRSRAIITNPAGVSMSQVLLRGEPQIMLPLESRPFSGELDFSGYPAGFYRVVVTLEYGSNEAIINQVGIQVSIEGAQMVIRTVGQEEFEKIGIKWR